MIYASCLSSLGTTLLVHVHAEGFFALKVSEDICAHAGLGQTDGDMHAFYGRKEYTLAPKSKAKDTDGEAALLARLRKAQNDYDLLGPQPTPPETVLTKPQVHSHTRSQLGIYYMNDYANCENIRLWNHLPTAYVCHLRSSSALRNK